MWQFKNESWEQDDDAQTFNLVSLHGNEIATEPVAPLTLLVGAKRHKIANSACSKGIFPSEFDYCPYCGDSLVAHKNRESSPWIPPYGRGTGLKILPNELDSSTFAETADSAGNTVKPRGLYGGLSLPLPAINGRFSFCSILFGAEKRLLLALQRDTGKISVYQPDTQKWRDLDGMTGEDDLPEWSWAIATDAAESGLAIPGKNGPAWVTVDWVTGKLAIDRGEGCSIGGIAKLGNFIFAPVLRDNTFVLLLRAGNDGTWSECGACDQAVDFASQLYGEANLSADLGMPVIDEIRNIVYWPCRNGYIRVIAANFASEHVWEFRPWETDEHPAKALIELGPPYRKTGARSGFWQLCEDFDPTSRGGIVYKIFKLDGDEHADVEILEYGQFVSTGQACFSWQHDCWKGVDEINSLAREQEELRYPLLQFGDKGLTLLAKVQPWQGREDIDFLTDVLHGNKVLMPVLIRLVIENMNTPEIALYVERMSNTHDDKRGSLFRMGITQIPEISVFIYDAHLYVYFPEENKCLGWPLKMKESL